MKHLFYLCMCYLLTLTACTGSFKKGDKGLEYKIISSSGGKTISYGNFLQMHIKQVYAGAKDSVLSDSRDYMTPIQVFDSINTPMAYYKILRQLKKGDSLIIRLLTDSAFSGAAQGMPPFMKKGKFLYTHVKLLNVFETEQQADSAGKAERAIAKPRVFKKQMESIEKEIAKNKPQADADDKLISEYLAKNNIKATKTKWGTYISVITEGTGKPIDLNSIVSVNYICKSLDSNRVFDSNVDDKFNNIKPPYDVTIGNIGNVILGWTDALLHLKKGSKATIYVPSLMAYGKSGKDDIKPNTNLVFDMEVKEVLTEEEAAAKQQAVQQQMMEAEKYRADSIQKATDNKKASPKK